MILEQIVEKEAQLNELEEEVNYNIYKKTHKKIKVRSLMEELLKDDIKNYPYLINKNFIEVQILPRITKTQDEEKA